tara:strand:+ start:308 stop:529 length:222 start_codon:yes stop_codon:yes gene_type:complete
MSEQKLGDFLKDTITEMNSTLFTKQMNIINDGIIKDASIIISKLLNVMAAGNTVEKYEAITEAKKWLKNNKTK